MTQMANTQQRATAWSLTINNPTGREDEEIALARQRGWRVEGQLEKGENGTLHYQIRLGTPQVRFSAVKKQFPRAHIEVARSFEALGNYVHKEETRVGELPTSQDKYPSLSKFWDLVFDYFAELGKEGFDYVAMSDGHVRFYDENRRMMSHDNPLVLLDEATRHLIKNGYYVEGIACNPSTRSAWKNLWHAIMVRCYNEKQKREMKAQQTNGLAECDGTQEQVCESDSVQEVSRFQEGEIFQEINVETVDDGGEAGDDSDRGN